MGNINNRPKINIIIPTYNNEDCIGEVIKNLLNQTISFNHLIIVNDGSKDKTADIVFAFAKKNHNIHLINQQNIGAGEARNVGLRYSYKYESDYTMFLDSDDSFEIDLLEKLTTKASENNSDITICTFKRFDKKNNKIISENNGINFEVLKGNCLFKPFNYKNDIFLIAQGYVWNKLFKTELIIRSKLKFLNLKFNNDTYFVNCAFLNSKSIYCFKDDLITYNINNSQSISFPSNKIGHSECIWEYLKNLKKELMRLNLYELYEEAFFKNAIIFIFEYLFLMISINQGIDNIESFISNMNYYIGNNRKKTKRYLSYKSFKLFKYMIKNRKVVDPNKLITVRLHNFIKQHFPHTIKIASFLKHKIKLS